MVDLPGEESSSFLVIWSITWFSYNKATLLIISTVKQQQQEEYTWELLAALSQRQGHTISMNAASKWAMLSGSSVTVNLLTLSCSQGFVQHKAAWGPGWTQKITVKYSVATLSESLHLIPFINIQFTFPKILSLQII